MSTSKDVKTQTHNLLRGEREATLIRFLQIPPEQISDPCHIILGEAEAVLELLIRNTIAVRTLSIPPYICLFDLMKMSEKSNTSAPFQRYQIHPQWKGHQDFQQNHANLFKMIKIV